MLERRECIAAIVQRLDIVRASLQSEVYSAHSLRGIAALIEYNSEQMLAVEVIGTDREYPIVDALGVVQPAGLVQRQSFGKQCRQRGWNGRRRRLKMPLLISRMPGRLVLHDRRARITNRASESAATLTVNHKGAAAHAGAAAYLASQTLTNVVMVPRGGIEPPTPAFSVQCSTN